ncbi:MAG: leucine-rich repeat protein [Candidatus Methanomethylophilaceae archaeon]|nr:leucine-rich repeat protein [Candidatus Methanomethylophilaceae archaeon]
MTSMVALVAVMGFLIPSSQVDAAGETSGRCGDDVTWSFDSDAGVLTLTGTGPMYDYTPGGVPWGGCDYSSVVIPDGVTAIGAYAFADSGLVSVNIPDSVTSIGDFAFYSCFSLESIILPDSVENLGTGVFMQCSAMVSAELPNCMTYVPDSAFTLCLALESVKLPGALTTICGFAFEYCSALKSVALEEPLSYIGEYAFHECTSLREINVPDTVVSINYNAFSSCVNVESVRLSQSLQNLYGGAFYECTSLKSIVLPSSLEYLGNGVFGACTSLLTVSVPARIDNVDFTAFSDHTFFLADGTTKVLVQNSDFVGTFVGATTDRMILQAGAPEHLVSYDPNGGVGAVPDPVSVPEGGEFIVAACAAEKEGYDFVGWSCDGSLVKPGSKVTMGVCDMVLAAVWKITPTAYGSCGGSVSWSFYGDTGELVIEGTGPMKDFAWNEQAPWKNLEVRKVTIGAGVTSIGDRSFASMEKLKSVSMPSTVTSIGDYAFYECSGLEVASLGPSVQRIGMSAYYKCGLTSLSVPSSVTTIGVWAFAWCPLKYLYIPDSVTTMDVTATGGLHPHDGSEIMSSGLSAIKGKEFSGSDGVNLYLKGSVVKGTVVKVGDLQFTVVNTSPKRVSLTGFEPGIADLVLPATVDAGCQTFDVTSVAEGLFKDCTTLVTVDTGAATRVYASAFSGCESLRSAVLDSVKTIDAYAFAGCDALEEVVFSAALSSIKTSSFDCRFYDGTKALSETPSALTGKVFAGSGGNLYVDGLGVGVEFRSDGFVYRTVNLDPLRVSLVGTTDDSVKTLTVPSSVAFCGRTYDITSVATDAFRGSTSLEAVVIGEGVLRLYSGSFAFCPALASVTMPDSLKTIEAGAFEGSTSLSYVKFPANLSSFKSSAFDVDFYKGSALLGKMASNLKGKEFSGSDGHLYQAGSIKKNTVLELGGFAYKVVNMDPKRVSMTSAPEGIVDLVVPETVSAGGLTFDVTSVAAQTFMYYQGLDTVDLGGVTTVYTYAFYGCGELRTVVMGMVKTIEGYAFGECYALEDVVFPTTLSSVKSTSFDVEFHMGTAVLAKSVTKLKGQEFTGSDTHLYQVGSVKKNTVIQTSEFYYKVVNMDPLRVSMTGPVDEAEFVSVPDTVSAGGLTFDVTSVAADAFKDRVSLNMVDLGQVTTVYSGAFSGCEMLRSVSMANVKTIEAYAFEGCTMIDEIAFSPNLTSVKSTSFDVVFHKGTSEISEIASNLRDRTFSGTGGHLYLNGSLVKNSVVTDGVLKYKVSNLDPLRLSVSGCTAGLTDVSIPSEVFFGGSLFSVTTVGKDAFKDNSEIESVTMGWDITRIYNSAFAGCTNLKNVSLNFSLKTIESNVFAGCTALEYVSFGAGLTGVSATAFPDTVFKDAKGNIIVENSTNLGGRTFSGGDGVLVSVS